MATRRPLPTLLCACLLVLAGCGAPFGASTTPDSTSAPTDVGPGATPTATESEPGVSPTASSGDGEPSPTGTEVESSEPGGVGESERVTVTGGDLPVNATVVFRRVERLLGIDKQPPEVVVTDEGAYDFDTIEPSLAQRALGYESGRGSESGCVGTFFPASGGADRVTITLGNLSAETVELILVHEYVHSFQWEIAEFEAAAFDGRIVGGIEEGVPVYVTEQYAQRYEKRWNGRTPLEMRECLYDHAGEAFRPLAAESLFAARYVEGRIDSPANVSAVYRPPPRTAEQVLHGLAPDAEPPRSLDVSVDGADAPDVERAGEIRLRAWLRTGLSADRAATAAAGWGTDRIVRFGIGVEPRVAWVLRMDSTTEADELAAAVDDLETDLESRNATSLRSTRIGEETVVVFGGPDSFVANATASGTERNVTVAAP
ncbi:hypothetical protein I7X12_05305 [Halosimplex litoreum]|uniref:Lipoprotein n=1 Tax=Halosimplex litoreum TaxID=1198301 RepID=A0A7T3KW77_9EURY|nr:hypothetical protein [Halosimplex litoreum]QPV64047.1 hypothetical protein I7X12_05305 [Halosimplex litoreum]